MAEQCSVFVLWTVGCRAGRVVGSALRVGDRRSGHMDFGGQEGMEDMLLPVEAGDVVYWVPRQDFVLHRRLEGEPQDDTRLAIAIVGDLGELLG